MNNLTLLKSNIDGWNSYREQHPDEPCNLAGQDLSQGYFFAGNFRGVNLQGANLKRACLIGADFTGADLREHRKGGGDCYPEYLTRSEEHTSELQSPVPISYAVFCLKKKKNK